MFYEVTEEDRKQILGALQYKDNRIVALEWEVARLKNKLKPTIPWKWVLLLVVSNTLIYWI